MRDIERLWRPLCVFAFGAIVVTGCGSDGDAGSVATEPEVAVTEADAGGNTGGDTDSDTDTDIDTDLDIDTDTDTDTDTESGGLTIELLCDPLDEVVVDWVGEDVERQHLDLFAVDDPASLTCEWRGAPGYREIRVTYHASPLVWEATVASGGAPIDAVAADNVYDGEILSVHSDNGWTIDVIAFEGDPPGYVDDPDVVTPIANAALAAAS